MRALRVRLVGLGASLVLVLTGIGGMGTALANHDATAQAAACFIVTAGRTGGVNIVAPSQTANQANVFGDNVAAQCVALAAALANHN